MRFVTVSSVKETLFILCIAFISYTVSLMFNMSGIISLLTCGVVMAHYGWYSLSPQGKHVSSVAVQVLGYLCEAFVFAYLGLTIFSFSDFSWSWSFVIIELFTIVIGRFIGIVGLLYLLVLFGHRAKVTFREMLFIWYGGLIRGPIAFGLVLTVSPAIIGQ